MIKAKFSGNKKNLLNQRKFEEKNINHKILNDYGFFVVKCFSNDIMKKHRTQFLKSLEKKS